MDTNKKEQEELKNIWWVLIVNFLLLPQILKMIKEYHYQGNEYVIDY